MMNEIIFYIESFKFWSIHREHRSKQLRVESEENEEKALMETVAWILLGILFHY